MKPLNGALWYLRTKDVSKQLAAGTSEPFPRGQGAKAGDTADTAPTRAVHPAGPQTEEIPNFDVVSPNPTHQRFSWELCCKGEREAQA